MANVMQSLFGLQQDPVAAASRPVDPLQAYTGLITGTGASMQQNITQAFGQQTPQQAFSSILQQTQQQADLSTPEGLVQLANNLNKLPQFAGVSVAMRQQAAQLAQEQAKFSMGMAVEGARVGETIARTKETEAKLAKAELSAAQEERLRTELSNLGPNATEKDIIRVVTKYGSPDKILQVLQQAENVKVLREQTVALRAQKASMLPAGLQKDEIKDLETIDNYSAQSDALAPSIQNLTPDSAGVRKLELGPIKNAKYAAQNLAGNSTPESRAYEALKSAVDTAVNLQVSAEKGVQTDKDVLRFAQALIAAYGRNDTQATLDALQRYQEAINKAKTKTEARIDARRKAQGVETYFGGTRAEQPTQQAPTTQPRATKRWNPETKQLEPI